MCTRSDLLRQRSLSARYEKARRGELVVAAPVGSLKQVTAWRRIPYCRVQAAITLALKSCRTWQCAAGASLVP